MAVAIVDSERVDSCVLPCAIERARFRLAFAVCVFTLLQCQPHPNDQIQWLKNPKNMSDCLVSLVDMGGSLFSLVSIARDHSRLREALDKLADCQFDGKVG